MDVPVPRNAITIALDSDVIENDSILRLVESCFAMFYLLDRWVLQ